MIRVPRMLGRTAAVALGLALGALPFVQYGVDAGHGSGAHADHTPHRGGVLQMTGDHHLEVVLSAEGIRVFVSDAWRRPIRADSAFARFDGAAPRPMTRVLDHLEVRPPTTWRLVEFGVRTASDAQLRLVLASAVLEFEPR